MNSAGGRITLRGLARDAARSRAEHCDLCGAAVPAEHRHLLELRSRAIQCACGTCAILFRDEGSGGGRYRLVPDRRVALKDFGLPDDAWERLGIPVGLAFLVPGDGGARAYYPGPMGPTEAALPEGAWAALAAENPILETMASEVEALLVNRARGARAYFLVSIDECFRLCAVVRGAWRGLGGGREVWSEIAAFFEDLGRRSAPLGVRCTDPASEIPRRKERVRS